MCVCVGGGGGGGELPMCTIQKPHTAVQFNNDSMMIILSFLPPILFHRIL